MAANETIYTDCEACGRTFDQPNDPGRKRRYCGNACKQRAYRARGGRASGTRYQSAGSRQRQQEREAWEREEARREQDRQRKQQARGNARQHYAAEMPAWLRERHTDDANTARSRRRARLLWERASHPRTPEHEAAACYARAEAIRVRAGL